MYWAGNATFSEFFDIHWNIGDATGRHWTKPESTCIFGQTNCPVEVKGGQLAIIYCHREKTDQPGVKVVLSNDGGETWDKETQVVVWDAYGKASLGVARTDKYPSSHDAIAYGLPHLIRLNDEELLASFWCTQSCDTYVRCCRLRVSS